MAIPAISLRVVLASQTQGVVMHRVVEPAPHRLHHSQRVEDLGPPVLTADLLVNPGRLQQLFDGPLAIVGLAIS